MRIALPFLVVAILASAWIHPASAEPKVDRPNVLMICIDDLNDWVEPLGGHPQVQTPALRELAERGMNFRNAHCQAPLCNPSRTSVMTSLRPSTTGVYGLAPWYRELVEHRQTVSLPQHFASAGYTTYTAGKVYHNNWGRHPKEGVLPEFQHWGPPGGPGYMPEKKLIPPTPAGNNPWMDWGVFEHDESKKGDPMVATWVEQTLQQMPKDKPFFMAAGFFLPHVPCYVTSRWWDRYDHEKLILPPMLENDRVDCSPFSWFLQWRTPAPRMSWMQHHQQHRNFVHAYLASITFVDSQVARVLAALEECGLAENTIVCLWSDHGYHLGEKGVTGKITLWERSTHVPLIFAGPGIPTGECQEPVELLDVYPTLAQLAGIKATQSVEGISLMPQLRNPATPRAKPAITDHNPGSHSLRGRRYRLIHYADGSEELYDLKSDPNEFHNLIRDPVHASAVERLRRFIPPSSAPLAKGSAKRTLEARNDGWYWEGQMIDPNKPPMSVGPTSIEALRGISVSDDL